MNTFIGIFAFALIATTIAQNYTVPKYATYFRNIIPDDRFVKVSTHSKISHHGRNPVARIHHGESVAIEKQKEFRYQVKLVTKKERGVFGCSGTIIGNRLILTASHCLVGGISSTAYFGILDQYDRTTSQQQQLLPSDWIMHPDYDDMEIVNDVALILLPKQIVFSDLVGQVLLPPPNNLCDSFAGSSVVISGWGVLDNSNTAPTVLQFANVKVASPEVCEKIYTTSFQRNSMLCADATTAGTCQGDSGGPMIANHDGKKTIIGIVSFGAEKCEHNTPRVLTCVAKFLEWILENGQDYF